MGDEVRDVMVVGEIGQIILGLRDHCGILDSTLSDKEGVLICSDCHKIPQTGCLKHQVYFLTVVEAWSPR